jgi:membrane-bound metal-dependent hydrolase YbcI (DUF457 family)
MASPLLHTLVGIGLERFERPGLPRAANHARRWPLAVLLVVASNAPDLDFIPGFLVGELTRFHRGPSHSLLAVAAIGLMSAWLATLKAWDSPRRIGALAGFAVLTHLVLDMLSADRGLRHGVELFWPFLGKGIALPPAVFVDLAYDPAAPNVVLGVFHFYNAVVLMRELAIVALTVTAVRLAIWALTGDRSLRRPQPGVAPNETDATD